MALGGTQGDLNPYALSIIIAQEFQIFTDSNCVRMMFLVDLRFKNRGIMDNIRFGGKQRRESSAVPNYQPADDTKNNNDTKKQTEPKPNSPSEAKPTTSQRQVQIRFGGDERKG